MTSPKITLITPPDIFQNNQLSFMFMDLDIAEQEQVTKWFDQNLQQSINLYFYQGEDNIPWLLHAVSVVRAVYFNLDNWSLISSYFGSYLLSFPHVCWSTLHESTANMYLHINRNRVNTAVDFLERTLRSGQIEETQL
jgi:hypothetical protein